MSTPATMDSSPYSSDNIRASLIHYLFGRGAAGLAGFATILLLVRYMSVSDYAAYTALTGLTMFCGVIGLLGLDRVIARYIPDLRISHSSSELSRVIWVTSCVRLLTASTLAATVCLVWSLLQGILDYVALNTFPVALAIIIIAEAMFQHFSSVFQALMLQKILTRLIVIQWLGRLSLIALALGMAGTLSLTNVLWILAAPEAVGATAFALVLASHLRRLVLSEQVRPSSIPTYCVHDWKHVAGMAAHNYGFSLLAAPPQGYFMRMLVAATLPVDIVAAYGFFQSLAERARQYVPMHFFYSMIEPLLMALYAQTRDFSLLATRCRLLYKTNALVFFPLIAVVATAGAPLSELLTGKPADDHSWILLLILVQLLVGSHIVVLQLLLNATGKSRVLPAASAYGLITFVVVVVMALANQSSLLLVAPLAFSMVANTLVVRNLNRAGYRYQPEWKALSAAALTAVGGGASGYLALHLLGPMPAVPAVLIAGICILALFALGIRLLCVIGHTEIALLKRLIIKKAA